MTESLTQYKTITINPQNNPIKLQAALFKEMPLRDKTAIIVSHFKEEPNILPFNNVFLIDSKGDVLWQIETLPVENPGYFTKVWLDGDEKLHAFNVLGFDCLIDSQSGKLIRCEFTK